MEWIPPHSPAEPPGSSDSGLTGGHTQLPSGGALRAVDLGCSQEGIECPRCVHIAVSTRGPPPRGTLVPCLFKVLLESSGPCSYSGGRGHELGEGQDPRKCRGGGSGRNHWTTSLARMTGQSQVPLKLCWCHVAGTVLASDVCPDLLWELRPSGEGAQSGHRFL